MATETDNDYGFDPQSAAYLRDPAPTLKRLQHEAPVFHYAPLDCWVITRHADLVGALRDVTTFSSRATGFNRPPADLAPLVPDLGVEEIIITYDPPAHTRHRGAMTHGFQAGVVSRLEAVVRSNAQSLIDDFADQGAVDIMRAYAVPLTLGTIVEILGIPPDMKDRYRQWSEDFFSLLTPRVLDQSISSELRPMPEPELRARWAGLAEANRYLAEHVDRLEREPGDDIISAMLHAKESDGSSSLERGAVVRHLIALIGAGHDTTANSIAHLIQFLSEFPDQRRAIVADPSLIPNAVEEGLRMRGSVPGNFRVTTREVTVRDVTIPTGSLVYLLVAAGGHDEALFPDSLRFDVRRANAGRHLAFGFGRHHCVGNALARLQARVALEELYRRLPNLAVVPGYVRDYLPLMTVTGLQGLDAVWSV